MKLTYSIQGVNHLMAKLGKLESELPEMMSAALKTGALTIQNRWKERVLSDAYKTGNYMRSIQVGEPEISATHARVEIGTDITNPPYPFFLEYGTSRMSARPTMTPAFDESVHPATEEVKATLSAMIRARI